jgi:SNF2 family DNA or RNA helicase
MKNVAVRFRRTLGIHDFAWYSSDTLFAVFFKSFLGLYKALGDNSNITNDAREEFAAVYQKNLEEHVFKNGGTLRDYQAAGVSWMIANYINGRNFILADEM